MAQPIKILLQTTIPYVEDDWSVERFSLLHDFLTGQTGPGGQPLFAVTARNRATPPGQNDPVLSTLDKSDFDELWLFAVDTGDGITEDECAAISRFRENGHGLLTTRDHMDLGSSLCSLGGVGPAHFFHTKNLDPDATRQIIDDAVTTTISWPNYHSGNNGDVQTIEAIAPVHPVLQANGKTLKLFPSHPHEGGVGIPADEKHARVIATGKSQTTGRPFNLVVAFESGPDDKGHQLGRAIAESSFHHFVNYNWDLNAGCPTFLGEAPGHAISGNPALLDDIKSYVRSAAIWLANKN